MNLAEKLVRSATIQIERAPEISPDVAGWRRARIPAPPRPAEDEADAP